MTKDTGLKEARGSSARQDCEKMLKLTGLRQLGGKHALGQPLRNVLNISAEAEVHQVKGHQNLSIPAPALTQIRSSAAQMRKQHACMLVDGRW
jgi:hypothetical protein